MPGTQTTRVPSPPLSSYAILPSGRARCRTAVMPTTLGRYPGVRQVAALGHVLRRPAPREVAPPGVDGVDRLDDHRHEPLRLQHAHRVPGTDVVDGGARDGAGHGELAGRLDHPVLGADHHRGRDVDPGEPGP